MSAIGAARRAEALEGAQETKNQLPCHGSGTPAADAARQRQGCLEAYRSIIRIVPRFVDRTHIVSEDPIRDTAALRRSGRV